MPLLRSPLRAFWLGVFSAVMLSCPLGAQEPTATPTATPADAADLPLTELVAASAQVEEKRREVEERLQSEAKVVEETRAALERFSREATLREAEDAALFSQESPLERLPEMEVYWLNAMNGLTSAREKLEATGKRLDADVTEFRQLVESWRRAMETLKRETTPREVQERVARVMAGLVGTLRHLEEKRSEVLTLQTETGTAAGRVQSLLDEAREERKRVMQGLMRRDRPPIWTAEAQTFGQERAVRLPLASQWMALKEFARQEQATLIFNGVLFIILIALFRRWQRWAQERGEEKEVELRELQRVTGAPVCSALLLAVLAGFWLFDQPPRLLTGLMRTLALIPAVVLLQRLVPGRFYPALYGLVLCFLMDGARGMMMAMPFWARMLFLTQMGLAALFCLWAVLAERRKSEELPTGWLIGLVRGVVRLAGVGFALAFIFNALGFGRLSMLGGGALLQSVYAGVVFAGLVVIWDGLVLGLLALPAAEQLGMVRRHRGVIARRLRKLARWAALGLWVWVVLRFFSVEDRVWRGVESVLNWTPGKGLPTVLNLLEFGAVVAGAFLLSKLIRFVLDEEVFPRLTLARGLPYAISTVLHYVVLMGGFFLAMTALGVDLTKVTILAGAFGVGLGFGLQNIVNNFVSGLILLFERPVNVGDVVEVDATARGVVRQIGIRASTIRTVDGGEVIVPNGRLISDKVINWTRTRRQRLMTIPIPATAECDPQQVMELLRGVAERHEKVSSFPRATVLLTKVDAAALEFELRAWTNYYDDLPEIQSDLAMGALAALSTAQIPLKKA